MEAAALQEYLHEHIPLSAAMQATACGQFVGSFVAITNSGESA